MLFDFLLDPCGSRSATLLRRIVSTDLETYRRFQWKDHMNSILRCRAFLFLFVFFDVFSQFFQQYIKAKGEKYDFQNRRKGWGPFSMQNIGNEFDS